MIDLINKAGINATRFGYEGDPDPDPESKAGHGKWVENMKPGYDVALNAKSAAMVGNPKPGEEFEFAGRKWRYGDKVPEKYADARFDIYDPNGEFGDIGGGGGGKKGGAPEPSGQIADQNAPVPQPMWSLPNSSPAGEAASPQPETPHFGGGGGGGMASRAPAQAPGSTFTFLWMVEEVEAAGVVAAAEVVAIALLPHDINRSR